MRPLYVASLACLAAAQPLQAQTLEQRVRRLEILVDSLIRERSVAGPQGGPAAPPPSPAASPATTRMALGLLGSENVRWGFPGGDCTPLAKGNAP